MGDTLACWNNIPLQGNSHTFRLTHTNKCDQLVVMESDDKFPQATDRPFPLWINNVWCLHRNPEVEL